MSLITPSPKAATSDGLCPISTLLENYRAVRRQTELLAEPLEPEDFVVQSMPDASPVKWHLAHTTWFFETFVLSAALPDYRPRYPQYNFLFNSYYNAIGERIARESPRNALSAHDLAEVRRYRSEIDSTGCGLDLPDRSGRLLDLSDLSSTLVLGLNHEQQHQELILTDIKHAFSTPIRSFRFIKTVPSRVSRRRPPIGVHAWIDRATPPGIRDHRAWW